MMQELLLDIVVSELEKQGSGDYKKDIKPFAS